MFGETYDVIGWSVMIVQSNPLQVLFPPAHCPAGWEVLETLYGRALYVLGVLVEAEGIDKRIIWKHPNRVEAQIGEPVEPVFHFEHTRCTIAADDLNAVVEWFERYRLIEDVHKEMLFAFRTALIAGTLIKGLMHKRVDWSLWDKFEQSPTNFFVNDGNNWYR